jgi:ABC-type multidrug transport system fused ATPase/permease subunit
MRSIINYFNVFYNWVGIKLFFFAFLILFMTIIEGLGFTIALPILEYGSEIEEKSKYSIFIYKLLESLNIEVSIMSLVLLVIVIFIFKAIIKSIQVTLGLNIVYKFLEDLRIDLIQHYSKMKYNFYINTEIGYFNNLITTEISTTIAAFNKYVLILVKIVTVLVYLSFSYLFSWEISLMAMSTIIILYFLFSPIANKIKNLSETLVKANASLQSSFIQFILNFKYLKATANFKHPKIKIKNAINIQRKKGLQRHLLEDLTPIILELFAMILFSVAILFLVLIKGLEIPSIMVTILFIYKAMLRIPEFQTAYQGFIAQSASVDVVENARKELVSNTEVFNGKNLKSFSSNISLRDIDFSFKDKKILSKINLEVPYKESIGIIGESGSGKTTLVDIITGLIRVQSGNIEIDGIDYKSLNKKSLRNYFGYITQEPVVFNDTIFNNVSLWSGDADDKECFKRVKKSCEIANCLDFIEDTENGFNTIVGDRGVKLSGGQKQRISIAREMYRDPKIFIFDEATSSLDSKSENFIQNSINNLIGEKTMIIIAHRLSTVKKCNYIYLLEKGRIIQEGTWDKMISDKNSIFSKMCQLQGINN